MKRFKIRIRNILKQGLLYVYKCYSIYYYITSIYISIYIILLLYILVSASVFSPVHGAHCPACCRCWEKISLSLETGVLEHPTN